MTWAAAGAILRRFWPAVPIIALAVALVLARSSLADARADLRDERATRKLDQAIAARDVAKAEAGFAARSADAVTSYADRLAAREPIILHSTNTVREYAQTDAGRVLCRGTDRVRAIDDLDRQLATPPGATGGGAGAVQPDIATSAGGR
jgi:hypothetical protein